MKDLTLKEKIGQMIGLAFYGTDYNEELRYQIEEIGVGLVIYFKDNCASPEQIFNLNKIINNKAKIAPFISLDQEGGMVARVTTGVTQSPGAMAISATRNPQNAYDMAYNMGVELRKIGFNLNFAPVGDINNNPKNPVINVRSYSENPQVVTEYVYQATKGFNDAGMMTTIKHFPGHGDTAVDSHVGLPIIDFDKERLDKVELVPFKMAKEKNLPGIMASHVLYTKYDDVYPTTLSKKVVNGLLREEIGYDGLVVTDSLTMKAVFERFSIEEIVLNSFNSGCDILLLCGARKLEMQKEFAETALRLAEEGKISIDMINKSVERILRYKEMFKVGQMADSFADIKDELENPTSMKQAELVAQNSMTLIKNENKLIPINQEQKVLVVFPLIKVVTLVENDDNTLNSLGDFMPFDVDKHYISLDPTEEEKENLKNKENDYDVIIYCSYNACFNKQQEELINSLNKDKLIVVAIRTPYDINVLNVPTYLCAYEASALSFKAIANVLTGKNIATGTLPVTIKENK